MWKRLGFAVIAVAGVAATRLVLGSPIGPQVPGASPELEVDLPNITAAAPARTQVASTSDQALVVWQQARRTGDIDVLAARVTQDGTVLDPTAIVIAESVFDPMPTVASDGSLFLVCWKGSSPSRPVRCVRVSTAGAALDTQPFVVFATSSQSAVPVSAFDGTNFVVSRSGAVARITPAGTVLDPNPPTLVSSASAPSLACAPAIGCALTYTTIELQSPPPPAPVYFDSKFSVQMVTSSLALGSSFDLGTAPGPDAALERGLVAASTPNFLVLFPGIAQRVTPTGLGASENLAAVAATFDGTSFILMDSVSTQRVPVSNGGANGTVNTGGTAVSCFPSKSRCLVANGSTVSLIDTTSMTSGANDTLTAWARAQRRPAAAFNGSSYLIAWVDDVDPAPTLRAARFSTTGTPLDVSPLVISSTLSVPNPTIRVASNGTDFALAWQAGAAVSARRVSGAGQLLDAAPIPVNGVTNLGDLASDGSGYVLVARELAVVRLSSSGTVLDATPKNLYAASAGTPKERPSVDFNGTHFVVAWEQVLPGGADSDIYAARFDTNGNIIDSSPVPISTAVAAQRNPTLAATANGSIIAWDDRRNFSSAEVYFTRVDSNLNVLNGTGVRAGYGATQNLSPSVVIASSQEGWLSWQGADGGDSARIATARLYADGGVSIPYDLGAQPAISPPPVFARHGAAPALVAFERFVTDPGFGNWRVRFRLLDGDAGDGGSTSDAGDGGVPTDASDDAADAAPTDAAIDVVSSDAAPAEDAAADAMVADSQVPPIDGSIEPDAASTSDAGVPGDSDDSDCSCSTPGARRESPLAVLVALVMGSACLRRRRSA